MSRHSAGLLGEKGGDRISRFELGEADLTFMHGGSNLPPATRKTIRLSARSYAVALTEEGHE